jgi:lantibiotic transport system ATP-binding protein
MRELLRGLNRDHGITIVISSHLLSEIDRLVTHIGIINKGRMLFQGTLDELKQQQQNAVSVVFKTNDVGVTDAIMSRNGIDARHEDGKFHLPIIPPEQIAEINRQLVGSGVEVYEISIERHDLERIFIEMVSN